MAKAPEIPKVQADTSNGDPLVVIPNSAASIDNKQCWPSATVEWINNNPHLLRPAFLNDPKLKNDGLKFTLSELNENLFTLSLPVKLFLTFQMVTHLSKLLPEMAVVVP